MLKSVKKPKICYPAIVVESLGESIRKIIHVDMDSFYASIEVRDSSSLAGRPIAVGGDPSKRGVIATASYEARKFGVRSAISSAKAKAICPKLIILKPDMKKYQEESRKIHSVFRHFTDLVEPLSLDEAYLDVSRLKCFGGSATLIAAEIRKMIFRETSLTASAGIAPNKFLAKVASDWNKPNRQFVITPDMVNGFVLKLPVEKISGVGRVTAQKMARFGIRTCADLQKQPKTKLETMFGSFGKQLYLICRGIDDTAVVTSRVPKSVSVEKTFERDLFSFEECEAVLPELYGRFCERFRKSAKKGRELKTLFVKVKFSDFKSTTVEESFDSIDIENFRKLLKEGYSRGTLSVRLLGLGVRFRGGKNGSEKEAQLALFS